MRNVDVTIWLIAAYTVFLILTAHGFDRLARVTARRSERWRGGGFTYHLDHDAWVCPEDQWLWPVSFDPENRLMRYRAAPTVCNACPVKKSCTTSSSGREMTREVDPWPHSEAGRFHRGISCTIALLAVLLPAAMLIAERRPMNAVVLIATIVVALIASIPLVSHFRHTPHGFPEHVPLDGPSNPAVPGTPGLPAELSTLTVPSTGLTIASATPERQSLIPASRRSVYGSDHKPARSAGYSREPRPDTYATRWGGDKPKERP